MVRPPCFVKLAQPCVAFHASTGVKHASATTPARQTWGARSHARLARPPTITPERPGISRAAVYLLSSAAPSAAPASGHKLGAAAARTTRAMLRVQNSSSGVSGVMVTLPAPNSRVAFSSVAAAMPGRRNGNSRSAASTSASDPSAAANGASSRTPSAPSPAIQVPSAMNHATIGG